MTEEKIICQVCGKEFLYTQNERAFLEDLLKQGKIEEVITPKKCVPCRSALRRNRRAAMPARREALPQPKPALSLGPAYVQFPPVSPLSTIQVPLPPPPPPPPLASTSWAAHVAGCMCHRCGDQSVLKEASAPTAPLPVPAPVAAPAPAPGAPTAEEIVVLVASDFEALVCREDVVWRQGNRKITIRLANIGPEALKRAMEVAVLRWWKS